MSKIYINIAWNTQKNIGKAYNDFMKMLPSSDDYACFLDGDATFTTPNFGKQLEDIIAKHPECGCFTAVTNRVACKWQVKHNIAWDNNNIKAHRELGKMLQETRYAKITDVSNVNRGEVMSGVLILIKKSLWKKIGGFKEDKMLGIDNDLHWRIMDNDEKLYLMEGVYLYHWYRGGNRMDKKHLL